MAHAALLAAALASGFMTGPVADKGPGLANLDSLLVPVAAEDEGTPIPGGGAGPAGAAPEVGIGAGADLTAEAEDLDDPAMPRLSPAQRGEIAAQCAIILANRADYGAAAIAACEGNAGN